MDFSVCDFLLNLVHFDVPLSYLLRVFAMSLDDFSRRSRILAFNRLPAWLHVLLSIGAWVCYYLLLAFLFSTMSILISSGIRVTFSCLIFWGVAWWADSFIIWVNAVLASSTWLGCCRRTFRFVSSSIVLRLVSELPQQQ